MDTGVAIFPTHDAIAPADMARLAEERGHESLFFPEHTHIPADRQSPWPGGRELPRKYAHTFDLFVAVTAAVTVDVTAARRLGHLPGHRAGPDHHRQGGGQRRLPVRRTVRVRRRGGLEPGGDGQPRHRPAAADGPAAGTGRGDEGDLDAGRGELRRRIREVRADLVLAQAGPAAAPAGAGGRQRARACWTGCWHSATRGSRTTAAAASSTGSRNCARVPTGRSRSWSWASRPTPRCSRSTPRPGSSGPCTGCRRLRAARSSGPWTGTRRPWRSSAGIAEYRGEVPGLSSGRRSSQPDSRRAHQAVRRLLVCLATGRSPGCEGPATHSALPQVRPEPSRGLPHPQVGRNRASQAA